VSASLCTGLVRHHIKRAAIALLLFLDCFTNMLMRGSFSETLSARAHRLREEKHHAWGWTAGVIDFLFFWEPDHCRQQYEREKAGDGVWNALRAHTAALASGSERKQLTGSKGAR
jgi:hypothetical protein